MKPLQAGKYRWQIQLQQLPAKPAVNEFNEPSYSGWATFLPTWANVETMSGRELVWAQQIVADATVKVEIRFWPGVTPKMRVLYVDAQTGKQRILNILSVIDVEERHRDLILLCKE